MVGSYTANLHLYKPNIDEEGWDDEVNANFDTLDTAVAAKAPIAGPAFTGVPTAPTADVGTNTTQLATTAFCQALPGLLRTGMIVKWSGSIATIPSSCVLCNGSNNTPDLRGKFVIGAGGSYSPGDTGGEASHQIAASDLPALVVNTRNGLYEGQPIYAVNSVSYSGTPGTAITNLPPYYALAYIMKT